MHVLKFLGTGVVCSWWSHN